MNKEQIEFIGELINRVDELNNLDRSSKSYIEIKESDNWKDYWCIDINFESVNSKYQDTIVFYENEDEWDTHFNSKEILEEFDKIIENCRNIIT